ncbi:chromate transporter [Mycoplasma sp. ATU-Cv-508]|uniref:chromate transporter n=1 Tax=Mycoplasma sp. ATU-Cv-508 TaxID=2048001 RepID=UPI000FDE8665
MKILFSDRRVVFSRMVVFGGGQAFMPIFGSLWTLLGFDPDVKEKIYLVVNSTPGVTGLKFGLITGFLVGEKMWSAVLVMLTSYLAIFLPGALMVWWAYGLLVSQRQYPYLTTLMRWLRPVIAGIALTLAIQLF